MEENKNNSHFRTIELGALETEYPVITEGRFRWVGYGESNSYPEYLLDLFLESPTNNAIVTATANMIAGDGLEVDNPEQNPIANKMLQRLFSPKNLKKIAFNLKLYGYAPVVIKGGTQVSSLTVSDANKWRSGKKDENGKVNHWYYSDDWQNTNTTKGKPIPYPVFSYTEIAAEQVFIFSLPMIGLDYYPPVDYNGGTCYIQLEAEIGEFHLNAIQNGLSPSMMFNFNNGTPSEEEQAKIESKVKAKFAGSSKSGKFFLSFNDSPENATTVDVMEVSKLDKQYEFLSKESTSKIMVAHRVTSPILFGIRDGAGLGNNAEELESSYLMYNETVVRSYQEIILDGCQTVLYKNKVVFDAEWITYAPFKRQVTEDVAEEEADRTPAATMAVIEKFESNSVNPPEGFKVISEKPYLGQQPKMNGKMTTLYRMERANPAKRDLALSEVELKGGYYNFEFVKDNPNTRDMYWVECSFVKGKE